MITAINKHGTITQFNDKTWKMLPPNKNGWVEFDGETPINIPAEIVEFQAKKKEDATVTEKIQKEEEPSPDEMKKFLADKGIKVHQKLGLSKLKALYYDHSK